MIRGIYSLMFLFFSFTVYSQNITEVKADIENLSSPGLRPLSLGKEYYIISQGSLSTTESWTDFAVSRRGFFVLLDKNTDRILLTRNGRFSFDPENYLINHDGFYVLHLSSDVNNNVFVFINHEDLKKKYCLNNSRGLLSIPLDSVENPQEVQYISPFLLLEPQNHELADIISSEYLACENYSSCKTSHVINYAIENMPISFDVLIELAGQYFNYTGTTQQQKTDLIEAIESQYHNLLQNDYINPEYLEYLMPLILGLKRRIRPDY
jgi:flagellar hook protein FlgE